METIKGYKSILEPLIRDVSRDVLRCYATGWNDEVMRYHDHSAFFGNEVAEPSPDTLERWKSIAMKVRDNQNENNHVSAGIIQSETGINRSNTLSKDDRADESRETTWNTESFRNMYGASDVEHRTLLEEAHYTIG